MKTPTRKHVIHAVVLASSVIATSSFALDIPGLQTTPNNERYAARSVSNNNVQVLQNFSAAALEKQIEPHLPTVPAGVGRKQVSVVEPVFTEDTPDDVASGKALVAALQTAGTKGYPVLVYIDAGVYEVGTTGLTIPRNVIIKGAGSAVSVIKANTITSGAASISDAGIQAENITQTATANLHDIAVTGSMTLNDGNITLHNMSVTTSSATAITVNGVSGFTFDNIHVTSSGTGIAINTATKGVVMDSTLIASLPFDVTENAPITFVDNAYRNGFPRYYGTYKTSLQKCHGNVDLDTGAPVPNYGGVASMAGRCM